LDRIKPDSYAFAVRHVAKRLEKGFKNAQRVVKYARVILNQSTGGRPAHQFLASYLV
jgi:hypothetical protein